jgi:lupus La protein
MKRFQPYSAVVAALKESAYLDVVGAEGEEEIKRKIPYDPSKRDDRDPRTVYAKGFGEEQASTQFDIEAFFAPYGPVNSVRLRRYEDKGFKGSVLVEFQDLDTAKKFLELETKPLWQGKHEIAFKSFVDYKAEKNEMIREGKMEPGQTRGPRGRGGRFRGSGDRRDRDPNDWKKRRDQDQKSGFRDRRDGRGGPGRGRGNRGNGSQDRGSDRKPAESGAEDRSAPQQSNEKRPREDDGPSGEPSAKVVKTEEATPAAS